MNVNEWLKYFADLLNLYNDKSVKISRKKEIADELSKIGIAVTIYLIKNREKMDPETIADVNKTIIKLNLSKCLEF